MTSSDEILQSIFGLPRQNLWFALIVPLVQQQVALEELEESIPIFTEEPLDAISVETDFYILLESLIHSSNYVLLWNFESWEKEKWQMLDRERSKFSRDAGGLFLFTPQSAAAFQKYAPNFASWVGTRSYDLELGTELLTPEEKQQRLKSLQDWSGQTDSEVINLAKAGRLPSDPVYGEWLVLLDRGDLVGR